MTDDISKNDTFRFVVEVAYVGLRFDKGLSEMSSDLTRSRIQGLIKAGCVRLGGLVCCDVSRRLLEGEVIDLTIPPLQKAEPEPENIPLDIVFEDDDLLVLNKAAGLVVHPGAGNWSGTLVNALLYCCAGRLSGIGGVERPGIVHRLDKETSGLMVVAKNDLAHQGLAAQLADRSLSRIYKALVLKVPTPLKGLVDQPVARDHRNRLKMTVNRQRGKQACTHYFVQESYNGACSLVECRLESGRTHQIRVHMAFIKHCLVGDPLYGPQNTALSAALTRAGYGEDVVEAFLNFPRQALHAEKLSFIHPTSGDRMSFECDMPDDFSGLLSLLER